MLPRLLDAPTRSVVEREKSLLERVAQRVESGDGHANDVVLLRDLSKRLDDLFMLVGERARARARARERFRFSNLLSMTFS
jgi:hypothetical protein